MNRQHERETKNEQCKKQAHTNDDDSNVNSIPISMYLMVLIIKAENKREKRNRTKQSFQHGQIFGLFAQVY